MKWDAYDQLGLTLGKTLFMFMYLANEPSTSLGLNSTIKWTKLKHNNVFINKLMNEDSI